METQLRKWKWNAQKQKFYIEKREEKKSKDDGKREKTIEKKQRW